jgi:hypothetical protein
VTAGYVRSLYSANLDPIAINTHEGVYSIPTIRYDYLKGNSLQLKVAMNGLSQDIHKDINPSGGFYLFAKGAMESNQFLKGFDTSGEKALGLENYDTYFYYTIDLSSEFYFKNPLIESHAIGLHFKGGYIDRKVNSFFNNFAGGILGMRGYPFYSLEGRQKIIGSLTYRMPLHRNMDFKLGHLHFHKLYLGFFYDYGGAFDEIALKSFKRNAGFELRLETFSYNLFPTRFFFQAAYTFDEADNFDKVQDELVVYPKEWRFYFGALFEFDLRERLNTLLDTGNSVLGSAKFW